jgi:serine/threonine protein kinase
LDNILLTVDGHIKLADYGLCKEQMKYGATTNTFCGTPEFMAPEILAERPYGRPVDWWAFGVLLYEMLLGKAPFAGETEEKIFTAILKDAPVFPSSLDINASNIIQKVFAY